MSERTPSPRRRLLAFALAPLVSLSGCLTGELWSGYAWPDPVVTERRIDRHRELAAGTLVESEPVLENGFWWCDGGDATPGRWWLGPMVGAGADVAAALLEDADFCQVLSASIDAQRSTAGEDVLDDEAVLELDLRLRSAAIGEVVPQAEVTAAAAHVLAAERRNAYLLAADPGASLPVVYRQCAERLPAADLRGLVGEPGEVHAEAWVFVDAAGRPAFDASARAAVLPRAAYDEGASLADRLAALRKLSLLVRVRGADGSTVLRLRPDRLWLLSGLRADGERFTHRSGWHLQSRPPHLAAPPAVDAPRIASTMRLQRDLYQRSLHPVLIDDGLVAKVVLTPVTLALDVLLGPGARDFFHWITGKNPDNGDSARPIKMVQ